jgi:gliding motility-associated lipoprotein GldJ
MKHNKIFRWSFIALFSLSVLGCGKSSSKYGNSSRGTGWKINAKEGGFQHNTKFKEQETAPGLVFVEGGTFTMGKVQDDVMHDWNNTPNQQHVQSFYIDETEVTNLMYLEFLDWNKRVYPPDSLEYKKIYNGFLPDTLVWRNRLGYAEVLVENYLRHPAYQNYPVVGVSWVQANAFAKWRSDRVAEMLLQKDGYLERDSHLKASASKNFSIDTYVYAPNQSFGGKDSIPISEKRLSKLEGDKSINRYARRESGSIQVKYRLPTETEWEYAALGLTELREYNIYRGRKKYPWDGQYTRNGERKIKGDQLANFKQGKGDYGGIAGWSDDGADITNEVMSYEPNDFGIYDMAGNVAEWVADVYRPIVDDEFNDFSYYRGNEYTENAISDGSVEVVTIDDFESETLANGNSIVKNLPGEIKRVEIDDKDNQLRTNFSMADNRNFRDGDRQSTRKYDDGFNDDTNFTAEMYNAPDHDTSELDSLGNTIIKIDTLSTRTSLVNDNVRVYKGGSWKDREYWLDPAQRRFYPEGQSTDFIGFRCAMSRVGSKSINKKKKKN